MAGVCLNNGIFLIIKDGEIVVSTGLYTTTRWKYKRKEILRRDKYLCQYSLRYGKRVDADTVHHIYPIEFYPQYAYCSWNLISLSTKAHDKMHNRVTHELTDEGKQLQTRCPPPSNKENQYKLYLKGQTCPTLSWFIKLF